MFNENQKERMYKATAIGGGEIKKEEHHGDAFHKLSQYEYEKVMRRILQVEFELVNESPEKFTKEGIEFVKKEMQKAINKEGKKGLEFDYKTKELRPISFSV